ncbi:MAG: TerB family tellurite resistance protein [Bacteroidota bacterium]
MEPEGDQRTLLQDLALIYIAFAHETDQHLSDSEIDVIAERLRDWQQGVGDTTALAAVKGALAEYLRDDAVARTENAIANVAAATPESVRRLIVDDLMEIAMADDVFQHAESAYIKKLEEAWDVRHQGQDAESQTFSVIDRSEQYNGWTALHDLALIYLTLAHSTDHDLTEEEVDAITARLAEWMPDESEADVLQVLRGAMSVYAQGPDKRALSESVESVRRYVPSHQHEALLQDLQSVASADGGISESERDLIGRLEEALTRQPRP